MTNLSPLQLEIAWGAYAVHTKSPGAGLVLEPHAIPAAETLVARGWLEQRTETATGQPTWHWAATAETALQLSRLLHSADHRQN